MQLIEHLLTTTDGVVKATLWIPAQEALRMQEMGLDCQDPDPVVRGVAAYVEAAEVDWSLMSLDRF